MEHPRYTRPWRASLKSLFILLMGLAIGYSLWPVIHSSSDQPPRRGDTASGASGGGLLPDSPFDPVIWPGRHLIVALPGTELDATSQELLAFVKPGGVVLRKSNLRNRDQVLALISAIKKATGLGEHDTALPLIALDLRDVDEQAIGLQPAPSIATLTSIGNTAAVKNLGRSYAEQYARLGIALVFTSILDVFEPALFAGDPATYDQTHAVATEMALAYLAGAREGAVIPVAVGFPGARAARHAEGSPVPALAQERRELATIMYSFIEAVSSEDKIPAIMVGHVAVPSLDEKFPARPASLSPVLVQTVLREKCRYDGVVVAEDITLNPAIASEPTERVAVQALGAGCDALLMLDSDPEGILAVCKSIQTAVFLDTLSREELDASKARLDTLQNWLRALDRPEHREPEERPLTARTPAPPTAVEEPAISGNAPADPPTVSITKESVPEGVRAREFDEPVVTPAAPSVEALDEAEAPRVREHVVAPNESLTGIANKYGATVKNLITWNDLLEPKVEPGQVLRIVPPEVERAEPEALPATEPLDDAAEAPADAGAQPAPDMTESEPATTSNNTTTHTIAAGDTLYRIAVRYQTTPDRIMEMNGIKNPDHILLGQAIKVPAPQDR